MPMNSGHGQQSSIGELTGLLGVDRCLLNNLRRCVQAIQLLHERSAARRIAGAARLPPTLR